VATFQLKPGSNSKEVYQGAGLLVWQNEDTFLRFEFGFSGMGGPEKNAALLKHEEGSLGLVNYTDLQGATETIELRLQPNVNQFKAWSATGLKLARPNSLLTRRLKSA
jgi:hypothetical protein